MATRGERSIFQYKLPGSNGLRGVAGRDSGEFVLMNFELLTFPCREMIKLSIHMSFFQNESIYIQKTHFLCDACIVYIEKVKLQMRFLHFTFFS